MENPWNTLHKPGLLQTCRPNLRWSLLQLPSWPIGISDGVSAFFHPSTSSKPIGVEVITTVQEVVNAAGHRTIRGGVVAVVVVTRHILKADYNGGIAST